MIETKSPELKKAVCIVRELSQDEETRLQFEAREKARMDYEDRMDGALEKGIEIGKIEDKIEVAAKLIIKLNVDIDKAMEIIDLDKEYKSQVIEKFNKLKG